jgi:hypothetical protein
MTQRPHHLRSLALLLSLSLTLKRLHSHGTLVIALGLKSTNHSLRSLGTHVTFSQTLGFSQTLSLSLYHLLLSSSQILKQTPLKSSLKGLSTIPVPLRLHVIYGSRFKQPSSSVYLTQRLSKYLTLQTTKSSMLGITALHHKREVKLNTSYFILLKKRSLRSGFLPLLLTATWLTIRCPIIYHSFTLRRRPSGQLFKILATVAGYQERRGFQMILLCVRRD